MKEGAELVFPSLAPAHPLPWGASNRAEGQETKLVLGFLVVQAVNVLFRAIHPELCLIQSKATWTHFQKQWLVLLAGALEWPWRLPPPPRSPESWATTDAPNAFSLLIKVKEQQILYERQCLTVCSTKQPERAAAPQCFQILQHKIWIC